MKKFTKGCAVDVRGMSEVMFETIKRVGDGVNDGNCSYQNTYNYLVIPLSGNYGFSNLLTQYDLLTPIDILGPELVKAIEEGAIPYFQGDKKPEIEGGYQVFMDDDNPYQPDWSNVIAYKPAEPSIESKVLSAKTGSHSHYFKDVSHLETIDVYRVIDLFGVTNSCHQHAIKKILSCGNRGFKDFAKDTQEAIDSLSRALEMMREDDERSSTTE